MEQLGQSDTSDVHNVTSLHGDEVLQPKPNESCVKALRELLERAKSGDVVGTICISLHSDGLASFSINGMAGPYSLLGAVDMAKSDLQDLMKERFE